MGKKPDWFKGGKVAEKLNAWMAFFSENIVRAGVNLGELNSPNGRVIFGYPQSGTSAISVPSFRILSLGRNEEGVWIGVDFFSTVFKSLSVTDALTITGLLTSPSPTIDDGGAFLVPAIGDKIWLQIGTADPDDDNHVLQPWEDTTTIKHGTVGGGEWDEYPNAVAINTDDVAHPYQEFFNLLIAEVTDFNTDSRPSILDFKIGAEHRQIVQMYNQNVQLVLWVVDGLVCLVPVNPTLNYIATAI